MLKLIPAILLSSLVSACVTSDQAVQYKPAATPRLTYRQPASEAPPRAAVVRSAQIRPGLLLGTGY